MKRVLTATRVLTGYPGTGSRPGYLFRALPITTVVTVLVFIFFQIVISKVRFISKKHILFVYLSCLRHQLQWSLLLIYGRPM